MTAAIRVEAPNPPQIPVYVDLPAGEYRLAETWHLPPSSTLKSTRGAVIKPGRGVDPAIHATSGCALEGLTIVGWRPWHKRARSWIKDRRRRAIYVWVGVVDLGGLIKRLFSR